MSLIHLRAEHIARVGRLKIMAVNGYGELPKHYKMWKTWRNKEKIQFLHVLPCRCGNLSSSINPCHCSEYILDSYKLRNKRWFYEEEYDMYITHPFNEKDYMHNVNSLQYQEAIKERCSNFDQEFSKEALELKEIAEKRFGTGCVKPCLKVAKVIAFIEGHKKVEKNDLLEAITFAPRL